MVRRVAVTVAADRAGIRLDVFVAEWLPVALEREISKSTVRKLIVAGAVRVDGRVTRRPGLPLAAGARLQAVIDTARIAPPRVRETEVAVRVLYEDDDLIAVDKPAGLLTHASADAARADLVTFVRKMLAARGNSEPGTLPYVGVHHRLDVQTSGVVLFTKRDRANAGLAQQFAGRDVEKIYHAIATRPRHDVPRRWEIDSQIAATGTDRRARMASTAATPGAQRAVTAFALLERFPVALLIEARPHTGRKHQIRAHLADWGAPIVGDQRYGGPAVVGTCRAPRALLHARSLAFRHPVSGVRITIDCPYPPDFAHILRCLRAYANDDRG